MNEPNLNAVSEIPEEEAQELLRSLLHKEGNWVRWGQVCGQLQKAGYNPLTIFEQTGFQGSHQNLIIVASQVYESLVKGKASQEVLDYFLGPRSDVLYELRILNHEQRVAVAELAQQKQLDIDGAKEVARDFRDFSRLSQLPDGFINHPGDAVAYQYWKRARQKKDLVERSRSIATALKYVHSQTAREAIEKLLLDFTGVSSRTAPLLPLYRLEEEDELPRIIPFAGAFPLTRKDVESVSAIQLVEPFQLISVNGGGSFVPVPGWQAVLKAADPIAVIIQSDRLPKPLPGKPEQVLIVIDRASQQWNENSYFIVEINENLELQWFEEKPDLSILGQVIVVLRPKKIFDENNLTEPWQMDD
jgi:Rubisco Assembly chaperone C-terminal domain/Rubisco accumulation factor 1 alpha helical domain/Rubisco accumulation factor 1 helix turn helix domain